MIAIIDYGSGNLGAIANIYKQLKVAHVITSDLDTIRSAERYILPGVGAFDTTMRHLKDSGLLEVLNKEVMEHRKKILGICVGMQILAECSEEGVLPGLGWIPGRVKKINESLIPRAPKLPHMGWNEIDIVPDAPLLTGVDAKQGFYFLHSYYFSASDPRHVSATVHYGEELPCGVASGNVYGLQFHPEKSHSNGMTVFRNFAEC